MPNSHCITNLKKTLLTLLGLMVMLNGWSQDQEGQYQKLFRQQILQSCEQTPEYTKTAWDLSEEGTAPEEKNVKLEMEEKEGKPHCQLQTEVAFAFDYSCKDPKLIEYFDFKTVDDTLLATIKAGQEAATPLQSQKILLSKDGGKIRFVSARLVRNYWLYDTDIIVQVQFDEKGQYSTHDIGIKTSVFLLGDGISAKIKGEAIYP